MRKLNLSDAFKAAEIIRKAKIREELAELIADSGKQGQMKLGASGKQGQMKLGASGKQWQMKLGVSVVLMLIEKAPDVQEELLGFIASLKGCGAADVRDMPLEDIVKFARELAEENDLAAFFSSAASSAASR